WTVRPSPCDRMRPAHEPKERAMTTIQPGDTIPDVKLKTTDGNDLFTTDLCRGKKVVLFAVPGAFTPTCSDHHLPGFVLRAGELRAKGVDTIACVAVNDAFVMGA